MVVAIDGAQLGNGAAKFRVTVWSSTFSTCTKLPPGAHRRGGRGVSSSLSITSWYQNMRSSASKPSPSDQCMPGRRWMVTVCASSLICHASHTLHSTVRWSEASRVTGS